MRYYHVSKRAVRCSWEQGVAQGRLRWGRPPVWTSCRRATTPWYTAIPDHWHNPGAKFAEVIQLTEEYYAPGSLGTFNLQAAAQAVNNHYDAWSQGGYELVIIPMNSGVFVNERGTSSTFLSLLTKQDVLDSLQQQPYANYEIRRMVGGGFMDSCARRWAG